MGLEFPNPTRSFDPSVNCVRFCGHDSAIEVSFFVKMESLVKLCPDLIEAEPEILAVFDAQVKKIHKVATKAYRQNPRKYVWMLSSDDF